MEPTVAVPADLDRFADLILDHLRTLFEPGLLLAQQVMCVVEEAGEFVGAYRRHAGMARRTGPWSEVEAELADVLMATHVTARLAAPGPALPFEVLVDRLSVYAPPPPSRPASRLQDPHIKTVLAVPRAAANLVVAAESEAPSHLLPALAFVAATARHAAQALGVDLDAAWRAKAEVILTRGLRDSATT